MLYRKVLVRVSPRMLLAAVLAVAASAWSVTALADSSPVPSGSPNAGASAVASAYAAVSPDTGALAINTTSGSSVFALAFDIKFISGNTVAPTNLAIAYSNCTACQTVAVSIQVVIYESGATNVSPQNAAIAINNMCNLCDTMASAYQIVLGESGPVRLTHEGRQDIADIREQLLALQQQKGLTGPEIQARVAALMDRLLNVLKTQLVPIKEGDRNDGPGGDVHNGTVTLISPDATSRPYTPPPSSPSPSPSASASAAAPRVSPSPSPSPSPSR